MASNVAWSSLRASFFFIPKQNHIRSTRSIKSLITYGRVNRNISDENRGQPIISQAVVHGNVAYFAGITPDPIVGDIKTQTAQVLRRVDELLNLAGTDKSQLLSAQVWIADMRLFEDHNSVWNEWVDPANPPARACLTTGFWRPGMLVEVMVVAAVP